MRVAVIGAGIVGVCAAYELAADGHEVSVFERRGSVAAENSFANAGVLAPSWGSPWAGMPLRPWRSLLSRDAHLSISLRQLPWLWRAGRSRSLRNHRPPMQALARYSLGRLHQLTHSLQLDYERAEGYLVLLRSAKDAARAETELARMGEMAVGCELLDAAACRRIEPGLNEDAEFTAGIHLPQALVANCRQFAMLMRDEAEHLGARFRFHTRVEAIHPGQQPSLSLAYAPAEVSTWLNGDGDASDAPPHSTTTFEPETQSFDAVLVCAALGASELLKPHGLNLRLAAVHGYSVTAPLRRLDAHPDLGPRAGIMDARHQVAISRFGARLRVAGAAELGGSPQRHDEKSLATLYKVLNDWFPGAAHMNQAQIWKGARPMLADGPALLGASGIEGVWLNLGHGEQGWALACGSARVLADAIAGNQPGIALDGLGVERVRR